MKISKTNFNPEVARKEIAKFLEFLPSMEGETQGESFERREKHLQRITRKIDKVEEIENILRKKGIKFAVFGKIGTGKSSFISSLLPSVILQESELYSYDLDKSGKIKKDSEGVGVKRRIEKSSEIEAMSILPVGKGRTTLASIEIDYSPNIQAQITITPMSIEETKTILEEYVEYLFAAEENSQNGIPPEFPIELIRFIDNATIGKTLKKEKKRHGRKEILKYRNNLVKSKDLTEGEIHFTTEIGTRKWQYYSFLKDALISPLASQDPYTIVYTEKNYKVIMPKYLYNKTKSENTENKQRRFFKMVANKINNGQIENLLIPKKIKFDIPNREFSTPVSFYDTKGAELSQQGTYINSDILDFSKSLETNVIFLTQFEGSPTEDIVEIINEASLYKRLKSKSLIFLMARGKMSEQEVTEKLWHSSEKLPRFSEKFKVYDSYQNIKNADFKKKTTLNASVPVYAELFRLDTERRAAIEEKRNQIIEELIEDMKWLDKAITGQEAKSISSLLLSLEEERKTTVLRKIKEGNSIKKKLSQATRSTHHMRVLASTRRLGSFVSFDVNAFLEVKADTLLDFVFSSIRESFSSKIIEHTEEGNKKGFSEETKEYVVNVVSNFLQGEEYNILTQIKKDLSSLKTDNAFWQSAIEEWGKGPGYRERVIKRLEENQDIRDLSAVIIDRYKAMAFDTLMGEFLIKPNSDKGVS